MFTEPDTASSPPVVVRGRIGEPAGDSLGELNSWACPLLSRTPQDSLQYQGSSAVPTRAPSPRPVSVRKGISVSQPVYAQERQLPEPMCRIGLRPELRNPAR